MSRQARRDHTDQIIRAVVDRLDPVRLVEEAVGIDDDVLTVRGIEPPIPLRGRVMLVAIGKASVPMATGALLALGHRADRALAITKAGLDQTVDVPDPLDVIETSHPIPDETSLEAGERILDLVSDLGTDDTVVMLISGGGSALAEALVDGVDLEDLRQTTDAMLRAGATINELNAVRKTLSRIKGGRLAEAIAPASIVNLIISDVLNSPLPDIASGPTVSPDANDDLLDRVRRDRKLFDQLPQRVREHLGHRDGVPVDAPDNVVGSVVLADAARAASLAIEAASELGYRTLTLGYDFQGEAREFGRTFATIARHVRRERALPLAVIGSGELTVTVTGDGTGGRNTEMALAAAFELDDVSGVTLTSFATDGDDGVSGLAGGTVDENTLATLRRLGIDPVGSLNQNDSATALQQANAAIDIGPTGTNVNDLYLALVRDE